MNTVKRKDRYTYFKMEVLNAYYYDDCDDYDDCNDYDYYHDCDEYHNYNYYHDCDDYDEYHAMITIMTMMT